MSPLSSINVQFIKCKLIVIDELLIKIDVIDSILSYLSLKIQYILEITIILTSGIKRKSVFFSNFSS